MIQKLKTMSVKKSSKIIAICTLVLVSVLIVVPSLLKKKVTQLLISEVESTAGYQVKYNSIDISLFRYFPKVSVDIESFVLESATETVLQVSNFKGEMSLSKVLKNQLELSTIEFISPIVNYTLVEDVENADGKSAINAEGQPSNANPNTLFSHLRIESLTIVDGQVNYHTNDSLHVEMKDIDLKLTGTADLENALVDVQLSVASMDYMAQGFSLKSVPLGFDGEMVYNLSSKHLMIKDNELALGGFVSSLVGSVILTKVPELDLVFDAPQTNIKDVLALLPTSLIKDIEQIDANGDVNLTGYVKGKYVDAQSWPAFGIDFTIDDAWLQYTQLSEKVEHINVVMQVSHPEGTAADSTLIMIDKLSLTSGVNNLTSELLITNPATDVTVKGSLESNLDLSTLKNALPMFTSDVVGKIKANVSFDGRLADIEQENYQAFSASGELTLKEYFLKNNSIPQGLRISNANLQFTPERINVKSFKGKLGSSDLRLTGYLSNYFAYLFDDNSLKGKLQLNSQYLNLNEFSHYDSPKGQKATASVSKSSKNGAFLVPKSLDIVFNSSISQVNVDDVILSQFNGKITVKDSKILLDNLNFKTLDGSVNVNGLYNSKNAKAVYSDMTLNIKNVDIAKATKSITVLRKMLPITQTTQGKISSEMHYYAQLDAKGDVDMKSVRSNGYVSSPGLRIANNSSLDDLAKQLNDPRYKDITTSAVKMNYKMEKGVITLAPFDVKMVDKNINAGGWYSLNNTLNFNIKTTVKAKEIGGDVSKYIGMVSDVNKPLPVTIILTGDAKKPDVKYDTREAIKVLRKDVAKNLNKDAINSILKGFF